MILPYYKIEKTEEGKQFFFSNIGYFNFWDTYLIMKPDKNSDVHFVLVNRTDEEFSCKEPSEYTRMLANLYFSESVRQKKPKKMFEDFTELKQIF